MLHELSMKENLKIEDKQNIYNKWADSYNIYVKNQYYSGPINLSKIGLEYLTNLKNKLIIHSITNLVKI